MRHILIHPPVGDRRAPPGFGGPRVVRAPPKPGGARTTLPPRNKQATGETPSHLSPSLQSLHLFFRCLVLNVLQIYFV